MALELKLNEETKQPILNDDGKIVCLDEGKELNLDIVSMYQKIGELGLENKKHRETASTLKDKFSIFEDIEDIGDFKKKADKNAETVKNFKDEDWMKATKVDTLKKEMRESYEEKLKNKDLAIVDIEKNWGTKVGIKDTQIRKLLISSKFSASKFFNGENPTTLLKPDMAEAFFGDNFKVEISENDTVLRAYYNDGSAVISKQNPGEPAGFEEAMEFIIDKYPSKDSILKAPSGGSGGSGGSGVNNNEKDDITKLKEKYQKAKEDKDVRAMIRLKGQIAAFS